MIVICVVALAVAVVAACVALAVVNQRRDAELRAKARAQFEADQRRMLDAYESRRRWEQQNAERARRVAERRERRAARRSPAWLEEVTARRLIVHTSDDRSVEGTVVKVTTDGLLLKAARLLGDRPVDMAGDVWVPRARVVLVQTKTAP